MKTYIFNAYLYYGRACFAVTARTQETAEQMLTAWSKTEHADYIALMDFQLTAVCDNFAFVVNGELSNNEEGQIMILSFYQE